jgi:hypothetical protein
MLRAKKKIRLSRGVDAAAAVDRICRVDFSVTLRDRVLKFWARLWFGLKLCMPFFGILKFWNFLSKIFQILKNTDLTKILRKLGFTVLICSNKRCILVNFLNKKCQKLFKKVKNSHFLAKYKLESCNWCHFVRIRVLHMTSNSKFGNFLNKILKFQILKNTDLPKIICKLGFRVLMFSNKRCILVIFKKLHTQNFEIWKIFEQKFCKTHI